MFVFTKTIRLFALNSYEAIVNSKFFEANYLRPNQIYLRPNLWK